MRLNKSSSSGGITFTGLLTCIFIALKLMKVITWSWFWVLSPTIFSVIIGLVSLILIALIALAMEDK